MFDIVKLMSPALIGLGFISVLELLSWTSPVWKRRRVLAPALLAGVALASVALMVSNLKAWTVLVALISLYRCFNLARMAAGRVQADYLFHASRQTALWLMAGQLAVVLGAIVSRRYGFDLAAWWMLVAVAGLVCALAIAVSALRNLSSIRPPRLVKHFTDAELPALTVAIPARNETTDLEECLQSLLASTYPKLEIIVLDDCSQNKRTPAIIRGFAHEGVRFIAGKEPPASWLAKNYAYYQLAQEANGDLLLFCGVDTRFQPGSLDALVRTMLQEHRTMISILPRNTLRVGGGLPARFMQTNRYAWELALPRQLIKRPPVLSTCWLMTRHALDRAGGFGAVRRKGVPESYLARSAAREGGYAFLASDERSGISSHKAPEEQKATAIRTRYLQLHRRPELTALVGFAEFGVLVWPIALTVIACAGGEWLTAGLSAVASIINLSVYARLYALTYRRFLFKGVWILPLAVIYDVCLLNYSMWLYEFREVIWKGRNVCIPVMRVISKLPQA